MARKKRKSPRNADVFTWLQATSPSAFIAQHTSFTLDELRAAYRQMKRDPRSARDLVAYHLAQGNILSVRRGVYAAPRGVDPFALANRMAEDAVLAYDGALFFHRRDVFNHSIHYLTAHRPPTIDWNEIVYTAVHSPDRLACGGLLEGATASGQPLRVTGFEETLVDCLDRLELGPGVEVLWDVIKDSPFIDVARATKHWVRLGRSPLLASRLGVFLQANRRVGDGELHALENGCLQKPTYFQRGDRKKYQQNIISRWNLIAPPVLFDRWMDNIR